MKRIVFIMIMCLPMMVMAQKKVAVYVTSSAETVDNATQQIIGGELVAAIVKTSKYQAVERTSDFMQQINKEQGYQHSGNVDDKQISALGKQFGVDYVCVASIVPYKKSYYLQVRMIDVETATVQNTARETSSFSNLDDIIKVASNVAQQLISTNESAYIPEEISEPSERLIKLSSTERRLTGKKEYQLGETEMNSRELMLFFNKNCNRAFSQFYNGNNCIKAGWSLFGIGLGAVIGGGVLYGWAINNPIAYDNGEYYNADYNLLGAGLGMIIGGACISFASSVVILPVGYSLRSKAIKTYNNQNCYSKQRVACTFNLQSSRDGFGIALTF